MQCNHSKLSLLKISSPLSFPLLVCQQKLLIDQPFTQNEALSDALFRLRWSTHPQDDLAACAAGFEQLVGRGDLVHAEDFAVERTDAAAADEPEEVVDHGLRGVVAVETGQVDAVGDVLDGVEVRGGEDEA